ncbi:Hypothetical predicted protein, partial [Marmota monax]
NTTVGNPLTTGSGTLPTPFYPRHDVVTRLPPHTDLSRTDLLPVLPGRHRPVPPPHSYSVLVSGDPNKTVHLCTTTTKDSSQRGSRT